jgi:hypothetical protein
VMKVACRGGFVHLHLTVRASADRLPDSWYLPSFDILTRPV